MFVDFVTVQQVSRKKVPFGIAQIGRSFRNEITPGNFIYRPREFEQMEMEFFVEPGTDETWHDFWIEERMRWWTDSGSSTICGSASTTRTSSRTTRSGRSTSSTDFVHGLGRARGGSPTDRLRPEGAPGSLGRRPDVLDQEKDLRYHLRTSSPRAGVDRAVLAFLLDAYREEEAPTAKGGTRSGPTCADRRLAPTKVAVLPLSRNEKLRPEARRVFDLVKTERTCDFDDAGSIGRRYRREDEVGTPFCVTVDFDSLEDAQVTVRSRTSMVQERLLIDGMVGYPRSVCDRVRGRVRALGRGDRRVGGRGRRLPGVDRPAVPRPCAPASRSSRPPARCG